VLVHTSSAGWLLNTLVVLGLAALVVLARPSSPEGVTEVLVEEICDPLQEQLVNLVVSFVNSRSSACIAVW
jgi:hypothetical protein